MAGGGGGGGGPAAGQAAAEAAMANMELRAIEMARSLERSQRGNSSLFGLFALARQQQRLAGRKAIVYFSEGLEVPNQLEPLYRSVVSEANRANLSIYSVDARGLLTTSDNDDGEARPPEVDGDRAPAGPVARGPGGHARGRRWRPRWRRTRITLNVQGMLGAPSRRARAGGSSPTATTCAPVSTAPSPTWPGTTRSRTTPSSPPSTAASAGSG